MRRSILSTSDSPHLQSIRELLAKESAKRHGTRVCVLQSLLISVKTSRYYRGNRDSNIECIVFVVLTIYFYEKEICTKIKYVEGI